MSSSHVTGGQALYGLPGELELAMTEALAGTDRPAVLDVRISTGTTFLDLTSPLVWWERS